MFVDDQRVLKFDISLKANAQKRKAVFSFRGMADIADVSICSDANILPLYDDERTASSTTNGSPQKKRLFEHSKVHRGMRDAVAWLIHQENLLKFVCRFADAGYEVGRIPSCRMLSIAVLFVTLFHGIRIVRYCSQVTLWERLAPVC